MNFLIHCGYNPCSIPISLPFSTNPSHIYWTKASDMDINNFRNLISQRLSALCTSRNAHVTMIFLIYMLITWLLPYSIVLINVYPHPKLLLVTNLLVRRAVLIISRRLLIFGTRYGMKLDALPYFFPLSKCGGAQAPPPPPLCPPPRFSASDCGGDLHIVLGFAEKIHV